MDHLRDRGSSAGNVPARRSRLKVGGLPLAAALLCFLPSALAGQAVRGVVESASGEPVEGAMVVLLDEGGRERGRALSNVAGNFHLDAPAPGRWRVRTDRIGYASTTSPLLEVAPGETVFHRAVVSEEAIELAGISVQAEARCQIRPGEGEATARVWDEVRKALEAAAWTSDRGFYRYRLLRFVRDVDADGEVLEYLSRRVQDFTTQQPYVTPHPPEELMERGFVEREGDALFYNGPDQSVLLSDAFLDTHCFRLREGRGPSEGLLGLVFEPIEGRGVPEIEGVMWIDPETAELRWVGYRYVDTEPVGGIPTETDGGRIDFQALPNGTWIIREWWIRMPLVATRTPGGRIRVTRFREGGGTVVLARDRENRTAIHWESGTVTGVVNRRGEPVPGAVVRLRGAGLASVADSAGRFHIEGAPEGTYRLYALVPGTDSLGIEPEGVPVRLRPGEATSLRLELTTARDLTAAACPDEPIAPDEGALVGRVVDREGRPVPGARVQVSWDEGRIGPSVVEVNRQALETEAARDGGFTACGVAVDRPLAVVASREGAESPPLLARLPLERPIATVVVVLDPAPTPR